MYAEKGLTVIEISEKNVIDNLYNNITNLGYHVYHNLLT